MFDVSGSHCAEMDGSTLRLFAVSSTGESLVRERDLSEHIPEPVPGAVRVDLGGDAVWLNHAAGVVRVGIETGAVSAASPSTGQRIDSSGRWGLRRGPESKRRLRSLETGREWDFEPARGNNLLYCAFSPDGSRAIAQRLDAGFCLYELDPEHGPREVGTIERVVRNARFAFSHDSSLVAVAANHPRVEVFDARTGALRHALVGKRSKARALTFSPDGSRLAILEWDGVVRSWRFDDADPRRLDLGDWVYAAVIGPAGERMYVGTTTGDVAVFDTWSSVEIARLHPPGASGVVSHLSLDPKGERLLVSSRQGPGESQVSMLDVETGRELWRRSGRGGRSGAEFDPTGERFALWEMERLSVLSSDGTELATRSALAVHTTQPRREPVFDPSGHVLAVNSSDGLLLLDSRTLETLGEGPLHDGVVVGTAYSPSGDRIAAGLEDGSVLVFDTETRERVAMLQGHDEPVYDVAWFLDGSRFVTASRDFTLRVWDPETWTDLTPLEGHDEYVFSIVAHPDGRTIYSTGGDGTVRRWGREALPELHARASATLATRDRLEPWIDEISGAADAVRRIDARGDLGSRERELAHQMLWARRLPLAE